MHKSLRDVIDHLVREGLVKDRADAIEAIVEGAKVIHGVEKYNTRVMILAEEVTHCRKMLQA